MTRRALSGWAFWQFTSTGRVAGITGDGDGDLWNGTREEFARFAEAEQPCGASRPTPAPTATLRRTWHPHDWHPRQMARITANDVR